MEGLEMGLTDPAGAGKRLGKHPKIGLAALGGGHVEVTAPSISPPSFQSSASPQDRLFLLPPQLFKARSSGQQPCQSSQQLLICANERGNNRRRRALGARTARGCPRGRGAHAGG